MIDRINSRTDPRRKRYTGARWEKQGRPMIFELSLVAYMILSTALVIGLCLWVSL